MKKSHFFTCILCPLGCRVELVEDENKILEIKGNECKKGKKYATSEFANPLRILTTTIKIQGGIIPKLPVRSTRPIPKKLIILCIKELVKVKVKAPIRYGDAILRNIFNLGVDIISSRDLEKEI
jgi:CxxC motif-containing protein